MQKIIITLKQKSNTLNRQAYKLLQAQICWLTDWLIEKNVSQEFALKIYAKFVKNKIRNDKVLQKSEHA